VPQYDTLDGFAAWARESLLAHADDERRLLYTADKLERGLTSDPLWNAAQMQMVHDGHMHGWCRGYWAKRLLEWTSGPEEALALSIRLNNRYGVDGGSPGSYVGCAWAVGGVHDQAAKERDVMGKVRWMSADGAAKRFNVQRYVAEHPIRDLPDVDGIPAVTPAEASAAAASSSSSADEATASAGAAPIADSSALDDLFGTE